MQCNNRCILVQIKPFVLKVISGAASLMVCSPLTDLHFTYTVLRDFVSLLSPVRAVEAAACHCVFEASERLDSCAPLERLLASQLAKGPATCPVAPRCPTGPALPDGQWSPLFAVGIGFLIFVFLAGFALGAVCERGQRSPTASAEPSAVARVGALSPARLKALA
jgi:hypothetical protein